MIGRAVRSRAGLDNDSESGCTRIRKWTKLCAVCQRWKPRTASVRDTIINAHQFVIYESSPVRDIINKAHQFVTYESSLVREIWKLTSSWHESSPVRPSHTNSGHVHTFLWDWLLWRLCKPNCHVTYAQCICLTISQLTTVCQDFSVLYHIRQTGIDIQNFYHYSDPCRCFSVYRRSVHLFLTCTRGTAR